MAWKVTLHSDIDVGLRHSVSRFVADQAGWKLVHETSASL
jgi:hypothetical protein